MMQGATQRGAVSEWARAVLAAPFLILDTETTGLVAGRDEIVQIAVVNQDGEPLLDSFVRPTNLALLTPEVIRVHGITPQMVENAPPFPEVYAKLVEIVRGQRLIIFNADFDLGMLGSMSFVHRLPALEYARVECAMKKYAAWHGEWNGRYNTYRYQSLAAACAHLGIWVEERAHSAVGDCLRTLGVIRALAAQP